MEDQITRPLLGAITTLLKPLVRLLLKNGVSYDSFAAVARQVYVDVASQDFAIPERKQTVSRISVITGLTRKEVVRLLEREPAEGDISVGGYNRAARVVAGWVREHEREDGTVADLPLDGAEATFAGLVKRLSGDMPVRAVLDELVRVGMVEKLADGKLRLLARSYVPVGEGKEILGILGRDTADLIACIDHNLSAPTSERYFQRKVDADNLPQESLSWLKLMVAKHGQQFIERFVKYVSTQDRDTNPEAKGTGRKRAMVGLYYYEEDVNVAKTQPMQRRKTAKTGK